MTILFGEHYVVETLGQFLDRTSFDHYDVAEALRDDERYDFPNIVREANELHDGEDGWEPVDSIRDMHVDDVSEFLGAHDVATHEAIIATLDADDRPWIHLFDGHVHDIVEVHTGDWVDYEVVLDESEDSSESPSKEGV